MSEGKQLQCRICGKPIGYVAITARSIMEPKPRTDNIKLVGTCMDCMRKNEFFVKTF
ncbi:MAG: hypothetical protein ACQCN4_05650 [Candidatus Bathyarchaeia archaeon]|jgi:hypothetical protein